MWEYNNICNNKNRETDKSLAIAEHVLETIHNVLIWA